MTKMIRNCAKTAIAMLEAIVVHIKEMSADQIKNILELCWTSNRICILVGMLLMLDDYSYDDVVDALFYGAPIMDVDVTLIDLYILEDWIESVLKQMDKIPAATVDSVFKYLTNFNFSQLMYIHYDANYISNLQLTENEEHEVEMYLESLK